MKNIIIGFSVAVACLLFGTFINQKAQAQTQAQKQGHQVVMLWVTTDVDSAGSDFSYNGSYVYNSSSSYGAPQFPRYNSVSNTKSNCVPVAEALAQLMNSGFQLQALDNGF